MANRWNEYPKKKPNKNGWYQCTVKFGDKPNDYYVMDLYYYIERNAWIDNRRKNVFNIYEVTRSTGQMVNGEQTFERIYSDQHCDRTKEVVAWKNLPKPYIG